MAAANTSKASSSLHAAVRAVNKDRVRSASADGEDGKGRQPSGNFVLSPLCALMVLVLAMGGARGGSLQQLQRLLPSHEARGLARMYSYANAAGGRLGGDSQTYFNTVSSVFVDSGLRGNSAFNRYAKELGKEFSSGDAERDSLLLRTIDRANPESTISEINGLISQVTEGHIQDLVTADSVSNDTAVVLLSAAFFSSRWRVPFDKDATALGTFHALQAAQIDSPAPPLVEQQVLMMKLAVKAEDEVYVIDDDNVKAVGLPYRGLGAMFVAVQPKNVADLDKLKPLPSEASGSDGFPSFEQVLEALYKDREENGPVKGTISLPRFSLKPSDNTSDLASALGRYLGVTDPFVSGTADFRGISGDRSLFLSSLIHRAGIDVDEDGSRAVAATVATMVPLCAVETDREVSVTFDGPFEFEILFDPARDPAARKAVLGKKGIRAAGGRYLQTLFSGRVVDALAAQ